MENKPTLIFDFDGTLVDSFQMVIEKFNRLAEEYDFRKVEAGEVEGLRDLTAKELLQQLQIPFLKIPAIISKLRKELHEEIKHLPTFEHLPEVLETLRQRGVSLGILTSNSAENVEDWLHNNKLRPLFNYIYAESDIFGKKRHLEKILKTYQINKAEAFYIGDETRDIEAAKDCNIYSVAVTWGFNSEKLLSQHQPHFLARTPQDILTLG